MVVMNHTESDFFFHGCFHAEEKTANNGCKRYEMGYTETDYSTSLICNEKVLTTS